MKHVFGQGPFIEVRINWFSVPIDINVTSIDLRCAVNPKIMISALLRRSRSDKYIVISHLELPLAGLQRPLRQVRRRTSQRSPIISIGAIAYRLVDAPRLNMKYFS